MAAYSFIDNINDFFRLVTLRRISRRKSLTSLAIRRKVSRNFVLAFLRFVSNITVTSKRLRHDMLVKKTKSVKLLISIPNYWSA